MRFKPVVVLTALVGVFFAFLIILNQLSEEMVWTISDFGFAFVLIYSAGLALLFAIERSDVGIYKIAAGLAILTAFVLIWTNLAVGLIGNEGNSANLLYVSVIAVGLIGASITKLSARPMSFVMFAMAGTQILVPLIALVFWKPDDITADVAGVFGITTFFAALFVISGLLFRRSSTSRQEEILRGA